jgi:thiamine-phosphate pyrophosphorylase
MADAVLPVTRAAKVGLVINDHLIIAQELGAEYCHLGQEDFFERGHRHISELLPGDIEIGLSSHAPAQAERAMAAGAAYIAIGPVYATPTKPAANPVTLDYVRWATANVQVPWFAIGGINLENVDEVLGAGARRICVVSAILHSPDIARTCQKFKQRLGSSG